jgi:hypothetical protein
LVVVLCHLYLFVGLSLELEQILFPLLVLEHRPLSLTWGVGLQIPVPQHTEPQLNQDPRRVLKWVLEVRGDLELALRVPAAVGGEITRCVCANKMEYKGGP